jgi:hypothetical protein
MINKYILNQFTEIGSSFYDIVYIIADKQLTKKRAQQWLSEKMHSYGN